MPAPSKKWVQVLLNIVVSLSLACCGGGGDDSAQTHRTWSAAELIETDPLSLATIPQIAVDAGSNAIAVWVQQNGDVLNIWTNHFNGKEWGTAELLETDDTGDAWFPHIAFDNAGNAYAIWQQFGDTTSKIWVKRFNGKAWGIAEMIETDETEDAFGPQIAIDAHGNAIAVWYQTDGTLSNIWANYYSGMTWGTAELIESDNTGNAWEPQIAMDDSGNAIAVWCQWDGTRYNIWANYYNGMAWGTAELIESDNTGDAWEPQIAFDAEGRALAVWVQSDGTRINIWANHFDGVAWGVAELIETDNAGETWSPQIAFGTNGSAIAVWHQSDGIRNNIWANRFDGTTWGTAGLIEKEDGDSRTPQLAFDNSGKAIAVWSQQYDSTRYSIWANRFDGTEWGTAELICTDDAGSAENPQIAVDTSGCAIAIWAQGNGSISDIWADRFE